VGFFELGNEPPDSIKGKEFLKDSNLYSAYFMFNSYRSV